MDKLRRQTFYPKRSDVTKLLKEHPDTLFTDVLGRIYGPFKNNPVADDLEDSSVIDLYTRFAWWVHIPTSKKLPITLDELLDFPTEGEWIEYSPYLEPEVKLGVFKVLYYPERIQRNGKSASIVVEISN
jgi:hypothetical protein